jgi:hypothetical protein
MTTPGQPRSQAKLHPFPYDTACDFCSEGFLERKP